MRNLDAGASAPYDRRMDRITWRACNYGKTWGKLLTQEARSHPAKYPMGPMERLADYGLAQEWWKVGELVVDPMSGVGCGGLIFSPIRVQWWGLEIDGRYAKYAEKVFDRLRSDSYFWCLPVPEIVRGDARCLSEFVDECDAIVTSPPYAESLHNPGGCRSTEKTGVSHFHDSNDAYGDAIGQVGRMKWDEYWEAMEIIYSQCHKVLKRQGVIVVNVRNYVRNKKLVQLSRRTIETLRRVGFKPVVSIRCMMNNHGSMFRRMNKARGLPTSDYDHFLVFRK